jgi:hypothetical protein
MMSTVFLFIEVDQCTLLCADTNRRNERGMTVLHVAAWRREPQAIANLLEKGAHLKELTLDNQTALDIAKRLTKKSNPDMKAENQKDRLCISILEQAERGHTVTVPKSAAAMLTEPSTEKELMSLLLYLENRGTLISSNTSVTITWLIMNLISNISCSGIGEAAVSPGGGHHHGHLKSRFLLFLSRDPCQQLRIRNRKQEAEEAVSGPERRASSKVSWLGGRSCSR